MTIQINFIFAITALHIYIKNYASQKINYFKKEIDNIIVSISTSNNISFDTSIAISICINKKKDIIAIKIWIDYTAYLTWPRYDIEQ